MATNLTNVVLAKKVEWEGGVIGALEFGIRSDQITDPEVRRMWKEVEEAYLSLTPMVSKLNRRLRVELGA